MAQQRYKLMHKDIPVCSMKFEDGYFLGVTGVDNPEHLPVGTRNVNGFTHPVRFHEWLDRREISANRSNILRVDSTLRNASHSDLMLISYGANLSDQYWIKPEGSDVKWKDINFFKNDFNLNLGHILMDTSDGIVVAPAELISPDSATQGNLPKSWRIINGERCLVKGSTVSHQEPVNEVIASRFCEAAGIDHVPYRLIRDDERICSVCPCMVDEDHEIVSAGNIMNDFGRLTKEPIQEAKEYEWFINDAGIKRAGQKLDEMLLTDILMRNTDRHWTNLGLIRNSNTLEYEKVCPLFDFGNSLYYDTDTDTRHPAKSEYTHQVLEDDIKLVHDVKTIPKEAYECFGDIVRCTLDETDEIPRSRKEALIEAAEKRADRMLHMCYEDEMQAGVQYE